MRTQFLTWLVVCAVVVLPGCRGGMGDSQTEKGGHGPVLALVAASTKDPVQEIAATFAQEDGAEVRISAEDSSKLAQQIVEGVPAHLFLSANQKWADFVSEKGFAHESTLLLGNSLVIVVPRGNPADVRKPQDLTRPAVKHLAVAGPTVPAGLYARQALRKLGLWGELEGKATSGENVRVTLTFVERGEAEAGIVYSTDARISRQVEQVHEFDPKTHEPIRSPLVLLEAGQDHQAARRFYAFLQGPQATAVFQKYGFQRPAGR
jgi:molybdate transport system substrate-binding protein